MISRKEPWMVFQCQLEEGANRQSFMKEMLEDLNLNKFELL